MTRRAVAIAAFALAAAGAAPSVALGAGSANPALVPTWTGTAALSATLISPAPGKAADDTTTVLDVRVPLGAGVELSVDGETVPESRIGKKGTDTEHQSTDWYFYGITLRPGPNTIRMIPTGADGLRGDAVEQTIFGPGEPVKLEAAMSNRIYADGKGQAHLTIIATDRWGNRAAPHTGVHASIVKGSVLFSQPTVATAAQGLGKILTDAQNGGSTAVTGTIANGGIVDLPVVAGLTAGPVEIDLATDSGVTARVQFYLEADNRKPLVVGIANAGAGSVPASPATRRRSSTGPTRGSRTSASMPKARSTPKPS
jgi:hypothetical protein